MPKRLSDVDPNVTVLFFPAAILENPKLASWLGVVINAWSGLETELGRSLTTFLHTQPKVGLAIYEALHAGPLRRGVLLMAAKATLGADTEEAKVFAALISLLKDRGEDRNTIAHGTWGYSPQLPDVLLRVSQTKILEQDVAETLFDPTPAQPMPPPFSLDDIEVYYEEDFVAIYHRIVKVERLFTWFWHWNQKLSPMRDEWRQQLCTEPRLAKILSPPKTGRENRPSKRT